MRNVAAVYKTVLGSRSSRKRKLSSMSFSAEVVPRETDPRYPLPARARDVPCASSSRDGDFPFLRAKWFDGNHAFDVRRRASATKELSPHLHAQFARPKVVGNSRVYWAGGAPGRLRVPIGFAVGRYADCKLLLMAYVQLRVASAQLLDKRCINLDVLRHWGRGRACWHYSR
jgi:hypothetical protein